VSIHLDLAVNAAANNLLTTYFFSRYSTVTRDIIPEKCNRLRTAKLTTVLTEYPAENEKLGFNW